MITLVIVDFAVGWWRVQASAFTLAAFKVLIVGYPSEIWNLRILSSLFVLQPLGKKGTLKRKMRTLYLNPLNPKAHWNP